MNSNNLQQQKNIDGIDNSNQTGLLSWAWNSFVCAVTFSSGQKENSYQSSSSITSSSSSSSLDLSGEYSFASALSSLSQTFLSSINPNSSLTATTGTTSKGQVVTEGHVIDAFTRAGIIGKERSAVIGYLSYLGSMKKFSTSTGSSGYKLNLEMKSVDEITDEDTAILELTSVREKLETRIKKLTQDAISHARDAYSALNDGGKQFALSHMKRRKTCIASLEKAEA